MKHLYILKECVTSARNGLGTYIRQLLVCLSGSDISVGILAFNSDREAFCMEENEGVCYYYFPPFPDKEINRHYRTIDKFLRLYIPDSADNFFLFNNSPCSFLMQALRESHPLSRQGYVIHDMGWTVYLFGDVKRYAGILKHREEKTIAERYGNLLQSFEEEVNMCASADRVVVLSEDTYALLAGHYPVGKDKLVLIPNVLLKNYERWPEAKRKAAKAELLLDADEKILLYVGRVTEQKGIFVYLEAFEDIVKTYPSCRLVLAGDVPDWEETLKKCGPVSVRVHFTGRIAADELEKWYQIADVGIFPSYTEQCSYVGLEMMAHGLPVVASDGFGVRCMFTEKNARIARAGKRPSVKGYKKELVRCTLEILASLDEGTGGNLRVPARPDDRYAVEKHRALYKKCLGLSGSADESSGPAERNSGGSR